MIGSITRNEIDALNATQGSIEWEIVKSRIKHARGGALPPNWNAEIIDSGLMHKKMEDWTSSSNTFTYGSPNDMLSCL